MLINLAHAADAAAPADVGGLGGLLPMVAIFILFFIMIIWPQMKRAKEQKRMIESLQKGDEVVTQGGMVGKVVKITENFISLEVSSGNVILVQKQAVGVLLPKGTIKDNS